MWLTDAEVPALILLIFLTAMYTVMFWWVILDCRKLKQDLVAAIEDTNKARKVRRVVLFSRDGSVKVTEEEVE